MVATYSWLPYTIQIKHIETDEDGRYYAKVLEVDGCEGSGKTVEEAYRKTREALEDYLKMKMERGEPIPEPIPDNKEYSGKFNLRIPKSLHQKLTELAEAEGVSLNQYILYKLSSLVADR